MIANQKLKANDNYEVLLFPLEYMNISQGEHDLAIDFLGWGANGRILNCPFYAPCSCTCIGSTEMANRIWQSNSLIHYADGSLDYVCWVQAHDNNSLPVGTVLSQGDLLGHTGTLGQTTGDHVHFNFAKGTYAGWDSSTGNTRLKNSIHIYDATYINDTVIINDENYNWRTYIIPPSPSTPVKSKFPWVLYTKKLRKNYLKN